jgi:hypothetical protein
MNNRAQVNSFLESISGLALRVGLLMLGLSMAYLLYVLFGGKLTAAASKADKALLEQSAGIAKSMLMIGSVAVVFASCIRFFSEETAGLIMTLIGGVLHFLGPAGINALTLETVHKNVLYLSILKEFSTIGLICLVPGCLLLMRDIAMQIARIGSRPAAPQTAEEIVRSGPRQTKLYAKCWDMPSCNERVKRICPAWSKRKSCWQVKAGCLCDQDIIRRALVERDIEQGADVSQGPKVASQPKIILTVEQKKERCRACTIYTEHQRQKFSIASPLAILSVVAIYALIYGRLSEWLYGVLEKTDKFMSFMTYRQGAASSFAAQGHTVTTLAMICLGVVLVSLTLKLLEHLIYKLQI